MEKVSATKESFDLKVAEIQSLMSKEVKQLEENYNLLHSKVHVIVGAVTCLVKFNNEYTKQLQANSEKDEKAFEKVEDFLSGIKDSLSRVELSNQSTSSQKSISKMVSNTESNIKAELAPILSLVLCLPKNSPRVVQVSQGGERGVGGAGSSKVSRDDTGVVFGKVIRLKFKLQSL